MKLVRNIALASVLTLSAFSAVTFTSCSKDDSGCAVGYEGSDCKTLSRDKFVGIYVGTEQCSSGNDNYNITIGANSDQIKLTMTNLYNQNLTAIGTMTSTTTFSFNGNQTVGGVNVTFSGNGSLNANQLTVTYQINDGTNNNSCTFTGTK